MVLILAIQFDIFHRFIQKYLESKLAHHQVPADNAQTRFKLDSSDLLFDSRQEGSAHLYQVRVPLRLFLSHPAVSAGDLCSTL